MKIIHLSYARKNDQHDPRAWLSKLSFFTGVLESTTRYASVESVHCISYTGTINMNGVRYHFLKLKRWQSLLPFRMHSYVKKLKPDAIIVHGLIFPFQIIMLRWQLGTDTKIICQHHAERPFTDMRGNVQRWADKYIGAYLFCSIEQGLQWVGAKQIDNPAKIKEVMGTSSAFTIIDKGVAKLKTKADGNPTFLWVGRLDHNKDPFTLVKAFLRFQNQHSSARLYMIYQTFELLEEVEALIRDAPNGSSINLIGKVKNNELLYWYNSADFIISSSHYEGSGVAVCEGLSCGCIPIVTNIPSLRTMTANGQMGLLYDPGDEDGLVACFNQSLVLDKEELKKRVLSQFDRKLSFEANARQIVDVIRSIA
jgi:glycosyltransferase involved in cell wall biosynthesis